MSEKNRLEYLQGFMSEKRAETFKKVLEDRTKHFTVVLEDIYQAHNSSAVVRTCDIFGVQEVYTTHRLHPFKISSLVAKGSDKWVDVFPFKDYNTDNTQ